METDLMMASTGIDVTTVWAVSVTVPGTEAVEIPAVLLSCVPFARGEFTVTVTLSEPELPAGRLPIFHVTLPAARTPPPVAETNVVLAGSRSSSTRPAAWSVPELENARV